MLATYGMQILICIMILVNIVVALLKFESCAKMSTLINNLLRFLHEHAQTEEQCLADTLALLQDHVRREQASIDEMLRILRHLD